MSNIKLSFGDPLTRLGRFAISSIIGFENDIKYTHAIIEKLPLK
jgi:hypothetical protein